MEYDSWIHWHISQPQNSWLCYVDPAFIEDAFNLYGLKAICRYSFRECIETILGGPPDDEDLHMASAVYPHARELYGLIHARFIVTSRGLSLMLAKYEDGIFGVCPRYLCFRAYVLPVGVSNEPNEFHVKVFCPRCEDLYNVSASPAAGTLHASSNSGTSGALSTDSSGSSEASADLGSSRTLQVADLDGAFFGTSFPHVLLLMKPQLLMPKTSQTYIPRIFGFRVHNQRGRLPLTCGDARGVYASAVGAGGATTPTSVGSASATSASLAADAAVMVAGAVSATGNGGASATGADAPAAASGQRVAGSASMYLPEYAAGSGYTKTPSQVRSTPLTTPYPHGVKPAADDFDDDDDDEVAASAAKRARVT